MLKCDVSPHRVDQAAIYTAPHTTTLQPHRCFVLRSYHEQGSGNLDFVLTNVNVDGVRTLAIEHFQPDDKDQQWFFNDRDWSIYNGSYPKLRVDSAKGKERRIILAEADNSEGQTGFDYTSNDQMMTIKGFPWTVDHDTNYVVYAGNVGGVPQNWHVEYCKGEPQPRTPEDLGLEAGWYAEYFSFPGQSTNNNGYDIAGKTPNFTKIEPELNWVNNASWLTGTHDASFPRDNYYGKYYGQLRIIRGGEYLFQTTSDDGSRLTIDGEVVVDNWGLHGRRRREKIIHIAEGWHNVEVDFFENWGGANLVVAYKGDDTDDIETTIKEHIYHTKQQKARVNPPETTDSAESNPGGSNTTNINKNSIQGPSASHQAIAPFLDGK